MRSFFTPDSKRGGLRAAGVALAIVCVIAPYFPLGPLAQPPWAPMAPLWAAYGWASEAHETEKLNSWRGVRAPFGLAALGLLQDQLGGGPIGLYAIMFLAAYLVGRFAAATMRSPNLWSLWAGFIATCMGLCGVAALVLPWAFGAPTSILPFAQSCVVTAILFPLVRPLYMDVSTV